MQTLTQFLIETLHSIVKQLKIILIYKQTYIEKDV
jgi:hypothetical protein